MMKRFAIVLAVLVLCAAPVTAQDLVTNGTFDAGFTGWTNAGAAIRIPGDFVMPASPSGGPFASTISSWGGDWDVPLGTITQTVNATGPCVVSGEIFAAAEAADTWRNVMTEVFWNGTSIASIARDADPNLQANNYQWSTFSVPVVGTGANTLEIQFTVHFAEWSWTAADNLQVEAVPEPSSMLAVASGLVSMAGFAIRRRR